MGPGCRKSGSANGSPSGVLRSYVIGKDGWFVMTLGIISTSTSVSDVYDKSFTIELVANVHYSFRWQYFHKGYQICHPH